MKQFRDSRYYVKEDGTVLKHTPPRIYYYGSKEKPYPKTIPEKWKVMKPTLRKNGYLVFNLQCSSVTDKGYFNTSVHRMVEVASGKDRKQSAAICAVKWKNS